jgi:hypothetical protein
MFDSEFGQGSLSLPDLRPQWRRGQPGGRIPPLRLWRRVVAPEARGRWPEPPGSHRKVNWPAILRRFALKRYRKGTCSVHISP